MERFASLCFTFVLLREVAGALSRGPLGLPETNADKELSKFSQDVHVNVSGGRSCVGEGRCKPCSRFEMTRQVQECLLTGYRQWAYCPRDKVDRYVSCHYHVEPDKQRAFWLFEAAAVLVGSLALSIVHWRLARLEKVVAQRIEQQIRA